MEKESLKSKTYNCGHFLEELKKYQAITKLTREVFSH